MGVSTIGTIVRETCEVLWTILQPKEIVVPTMQDWLDIAEGFYSKTQFPNCVGAVDGKHIRLECPPKSGTLYYNYKHFFSIILMAICDATYCFTIIDVGSYTHMARRVIATFLRNRHLEKNYTMVKSIFPNLNVYQKMMVVFLNPTARQNKECTFGILSNKWRVFHTALLVEPDFGVAITKACCVLHNFVRRRNGFYPEDTKTCDMEDVNQKIGVGNSTSVAKDVRDYFVDYFNQPTHELCWQNKILIPFVLPSYGKNIFKRTNFFPEYLIFNGSSPNTLHIGGGAEALK
ncbi:uncharacterized protein LOC132953562 [Metopolophium dirhodum]|uniref:uncharacterized protein LOC132953562 n=1 Tax=Metopolophium dirhodum TaxID=44670 RepID=UPI0029903702|nr:uncharacterized protein LOC132953562 [Metopolophium dirhodum]